MNAIQLFMTTDVSCILIDDGQRLTRSPVYGCCSSMLLSNSTFCELLESEISLIVIMDSKLGRIRRGDSVRLVCRRHLNMRQCVDKMTRWMNWNTHTVNVRQYTNATVHLSQLLSSSAIFTPSI
jgi:hypothetical protein